MTTTDNLFAGIKPPQFFAIDRKRACLICRLVAVCVREICLECRKDLPARLADIEQQQTTIRTQIDSALAKYQEAEQAATDTDRGAFDRMVAEWEKIRTHSVPIEKLQEFKSRYAVARTHKGTFGTLVNAWHDYRATQPLHDELARLEKAAAAIKVAVAAVDWSIE